MCAEPLVGGRDDLVEPGGQDVGATAASAAGCRAQPARPAATSTARAASSRAAGAQAARRGIRVELVDGGARRAGSSGRREPPGGPPASAAAASTSVTQAVAGRRRVVVERGEAGSASRRRPAGPGRRRARPARSQVAALGVGQQCRRPRRRSAKPWSTVAAPARSSSAARARPHARCLARRVPASTGVGRGDGPAAAPTCRAASVGRGRRAVEDGDLGLGRRPARRPRSAVACEPATAAPARAPGAVAVGRVGGTSRACSSRCAGLAAAARPSRRAAAASAARRCASSTRAGLLGAEPSAARAAVLAAAQQGGPPRRGGPAGRAVSVALGDLLLAVGHGVAAGRAGCGWSALPQTWHGTPSREGAGELGGHAREPSSTTELLEPGRGRRCTAVAGVAGVRRRGATRCGSSPSRRDGRLGRRRRRSARGSRLVAYGAGGSMRPGRTPARPARRAARRPGWRRPAVVLGRLGAPVEPARAATARPPAHATARASSRPPGRRTLGREGLHRGRGSRVGRARQGGRRRPGRARRGRRHARRRARGRRPARRTLGPGGTGCAALVRGPARAAGRRASVLGAVEGQPGLRGGVAARPELGRAALARSSRSRRRVEPAPAAARARGLGRRGPASRVTCRTHGAAGPRRRRSPARRPRRSLGGSRPPPGPRSCQQPATAGSPRWDRVEPPAAVAQPLLDPVEPARCGRAAGAPAGGPRSVARRKAWNSPCGSSATCRTGGGSCPTSSVTSARPRRAGRTGSCRCRSWSRVIARRRLLAGGARAALLGPLHSGVRRTGTAGPDARTRGPPGARRRSARGRTAAVLTPARRRGPSP